MRDVLDETGGSSGSNYSVECTVPQHGVKGLIVSNALNPKFVGSLRGRRSGSA